MQSKGADFGRGCAYYWLLNDGDNGVKWSGEPNSQNVYNSTSDDRSMFGQKSDGTFVFACSYSGLNGDQQAELLKQLGCVRGVNLDGGNSTCMICEGTSEVSTTRKIVDALVVVEKENVIQPSTDLTGINLIAKNTPFRVRQSPVSGTQLDMVPVGGKAKILKFLTGFQSDGYQWAYVEYNGQRGYSQLDTSNDYLIQKDSTSSTIYLNANKIQFRVRQSPVSGAQLDMVPIGGKAKINSFQNSFGSDGYQWVNVTYNRVTGWSQLDLYNAYTIIRNVLESEHGWSQLDLYNAYTITDK